MAVSTIQAIKKTVTEAVSACITSDRLDEAACVVKGAKVVGLKSAHGYEYTPKAIAEAKTLYEGAPVYVGHSTKGRNGSYGERIAVVRNFEARADGGYADIHYNPKHPLAEQFVHDVKNNPDKLGFSHHAETMQRRAGGKTVVEAIERVHSVDLVNAPATTRGVFESLASDQPETPMPTTLKAVLEAIPADTFGRTALENLMGDGGGYSADMPVEVADGASADGQAKAAFRSMVMAAFDDESLDAKATLAKIKAILKAQDDIAGAGAGGSASGSAGASGGSGGSSNDNPEKKEAKEAMTETPEQIKAERDRLKREVEVRNLIAAEKRTATESQVKACVALEAEADRKAFVNDLPKVDAKAAGGGVQKPGRSSSVLESSPDGGPVEPPKFATNEERIAFLRG